MALNQEFEVQPQIHPNLMYILAFYVRSNWPLGALDGGGNSLDAFWQRLRFRLPMVASTAGLTCFENSSYFAEPQGRSAWIRLLQASGSWSRPELAAGTFLDTGHLCWPGDCSEQGSPLAFARPHPS